MTNHEQKAKELIESFYTCMPFKDSKLGSCDEKPELIVRMEMLSAKQCALVAVDQILLNIDATIFYHGDSTSLPWNKEYWLGVKRNIEHFKL